MSKATAVRNEEIADKWHEQIFEAVSQLFIEKGYHATSMRDISNTSGINLSYLYKYVSSKNEMLYIFYDRGRRLFSWVYENIDEHPEEDPRKQMKQFVEDILTIIHENKKLLRTMWTEARHLRSEWLKRVLDKEYSCVLAVEGIIARGVERGQFKVDDTLIAANSIQYLMFLEPMRGWVLRDKYDLADLVASLTDHVLKYLGAEPL